MESSPDSSLYILKQLDQKSLGSKEEKAKFALLLSQALDKNYIDVTKFDIIQPALDYYLEKGKPDEKIKTFYYQGRIFQNKGDLDNAMSSFVKAYVIAEKKSDSLMMVRVLAAQADLFFKFHDFQNYTNCHLKAADISKHLSRKDYEFECLLNALNGSLLTNDKYKADSILHICTDYESLNNEQNQSLLRYRIIYGIQYGSESELINLIDRKSQLIESDISTSLNLAYAYHKLGNNSKAKQILEYIDQSGIEYDTLKYLSISVSVLKKLGLYKEALTNYESFCFIVDSIDNLKLNHKIQLIQDKHKIELKAQKDAKEKSQIIWGFISGIIILSLVIIVLLMIIRSNRNKKYIAIHKAKTTELENKQLMSEKDLAIKKAKITELENEKLKTESDKLTLEKSQLSLEFRNLQLENDKKSLETENLLHRIETLENEKDSLKNLIETKEELPEEIRKTIKVRIEMLNSLLASYITSNDKYEKPYDTWVKELTQNTEEFMNSNRLAFQASHPLFIQYFEEHGLTPDEINYVCLYAIGLKGKEVGKYMKKCSHVNISSTIRKKLGIDKYETNIGIYVRKLLKNL